MSVTITTVATKPEGVVWWPQLNPENHAAQLAENEWAAQQPGCISIVYGNPSENVATITATFDTIENYRAWQAARSLRPSCEERYQYILANNIIVTYVYE